MFYQASLFDEADAPPRARNLSSASRTELSDGAWVDTVLNWIEGSQSVFDDLISAVTWRAARRKMYDRVVDVPRLVSFFDEGDALHHPALSTAREQLSEHYAAELREPFVTAGMCYYRNGNDSVAWHGDRIGRGKTHDTMVAIISLGESRCLALRPNGGGKSLRFNLGHGDLLVMGGSCQRTWEHCVPRTTKAVGPRISVQFRPRNVR